MNMNSDYPIKARKTAKNNDLLVTVLATRASAGWAAIRVP